MPCENDGTCKSLVIRFATVLRRSMPRGISQLGLKSALAAVLACGATVATAEAPKRGGILTYMIPADGGPSLDGHRETTFAVVHATAPFYSVLIRVNPRQSVFDHRFRVRPVHRNAEADGQWADLLRSRSARA